MYRNIVSVAVCIILPGPHIILQGTCCCYIHYTDWHGYRPQIQYGSVFSTLLKVSLQLNRSKVSQAVLGLTSLAVVGLAVLGTQLSQFYFSKT